MLPVKKIICPIDFSEPSLAVLQTAEELSVHFSAELIVVHVTETIQPVESEIGKKETRADEAYEKQVQKQAEDMVADLVEHRLGDQVLVRADVAVGEAAREIVRTAEKEQADLIVISTRGRTGWGRLVFGSVAEKVVRTAHCPTLTVRAPEGEKPRTSRPT